MGTALERGEGRGGEGGKLYAAGGGEVGGTKRPGEGRVRRRAEYFI